MKVARYMTSWVLYWTGHALSIPLRLRPFAFLYSAYNRIMLASASSQGEMERGPWRDATESDTDPRCACS